MKKLRDYQLEALNAIDAAVAAGHRSGVIALATGLGKTVTAANAIKRRIHLGRALFTAPLDAVVSQSAVAIQAEIPGATVGIVKAALNQVNSQVVVASLQTLNREKRIAELETSIQTRGQFATIVIDECHLNLDGYSKIIKRLASPDTVIIGLSATPYRLDGRGLGEVFETTFDSMELAEGIDKGWLVEFECFQFSLKGVNRSIKIASRGGDLDQSSVAAFIRSAENWKEQLFSEWQKYAANLQTVFFLPRVEMVYEFAEFLRENGVKAQGVDGSGKNKGDRADHLRRYENREIQALVNVFCLSTGWDSPITECLVLGTLTSSKSRFIQTIGRGARIEDNLAKVIDQIPTPEARKQAIAESPKPNFKILDLVGNTKIHKKIYNTASLAGAQKIKKGERFLEARERGDQERAESEERQRIEIELEAKRVKLIEDAQKARNEKRRGFEWQTDFFNPGQEKLFVRDVTLIVRQMADGSAWIAVDSQRQFHFVNGSPEACKRAAEEYAKKLLFNDENAKWRQKPASEKQITLLNKFKIPHAEGITSGEASALIAKVFERKKGVATV